MAEDINSGEVATAEAVRKKASRALLRPSRFPHAWLDVVAQITTALTSALSHGFDRLRVYIGTPHNLPGATPPPRSAFYDQLQHKLRRSASSRSSSPVDGFRQHDTVSEEIALHAPPYRA